MTMTHTRLALCSDTHFWPGAAQRFGNGGSQMQPWSQEIEQTLLAEIAAAHPDLVVHLGDFTCGGGSFAMPNDIFDATLRNVIGAFNQLAAGFTGVPGNHDAPLGEKWALAESLLALPPGQGCTLDTPQARLILLNAQGHDRTQIDDALPKDPTYGWVAPAELARLEADLAGAAGRPVLIFLHQLLFHWAGAEPWAELYGVANRDAVLRILARYPDVAAVFQGHAHRLDINPIATGENSLWSIVLPAVIEYPMAWLEVDLTASSLNLTVRRLPLPDLAADSRQRDDISWRAGRAAWQAVTIPLHKNPIE